MSKVAAATRSSNKPKRRAPQRTCVSCRTTTDKRDLVRIVRGPEGHVAADQTGKASGRGAYLCANQRCWESGMKTGVLARALRTTISEANAKLLAEYGLSLSEGVA